LLEVGELLEGDEFLLLRRLRLVAWERAVRPVSQHHFVKDLGRVLDEGNFVCYDVEEDQLAQVDC